MRSKVQYPAFGREGVVLAESIGEEWADARVQLLCFLRCMEAWPGIPMTKAVWVIMSTRVLVVMQQRLVQLIRVSVTGENNAVGFLSTDSTISTGSNSCLEVQ